MGYLGRSCFGGAMKLLKMIDYIFLLSHLVIVGCLPFWATTNPPHVKVSSPTYLIPMNLALNMTLSSLSPHLSSSSRHDLTDSYPGFRNADGVTLDEMD